MSLMGKLGLWGFNERDRPSIELKNREASEKILTIIFNNLLLI